MIKESFLVKLLKWGAIGGLFFIFISFVLLPAFQKNAATKQDFENANIVPAPVGEISREDAALFFPDKQGCLSGEDAAPNVGYTWKWGDLDEKFCKEKFLDETQFSICLLKNLNSFLRNPKNAAGFEFEAHLMKVNFSDDFRRDFHKYYSEKNFLDTPSYYTQKGGLGELFTDPKKFVIGAAKLQLPGKYKISVYVSGPEKISAIFEPIEVEMASDNAFYYMNFNGPIGLTENGVERDGYGLGFGNIAGNVSLSSDFSVNQSFAGSGAFGTSIEQIAGNEQLNLNPNTRGVAINVKAEPTGKTRSIQFANTLATPILLHAKPANTEKYSSISLLYNVFTSAGKEYTKGDSLLLWQPIGGQCVDFLGTQNWMYDTRNKGDPPTYMLYYDLSGIPEKQRLAGDVYSKTVFYGTGTYSIMPIGVAKNNSLFKKDLEIKTPLGQATPGNSLLLAGTPKTKFNSTDSIASNFEQVFELVREGLMCVQKKGSTEKLETTIRWNESKLFDYIGTQIETAKNTCIKKPEVEVGIKAALVQFGNYLEQPELESLDPFLEKAFSDATKGMVTLNIQTGKTIPFPQENQEHDYSKIKQKYPWIETDDIQRLWYYDAGLTQLQSDIGAGLSDSNFDLKNFDLLIVATDAQFEGNGYLLNENSTAVGLPIVLVNTFGIGGWANGFPYPRDKESEYQIADETIHEVGHFMGLGHACSTCNSSGKESGVLDEKCCQECEWKDDATSYCRQRPIFTSDKYYNKFLSCSLDFIENKFISAFENGQIPKQIENVCG